ncbi:MAG: type II secretion system secretin GspD [Gammaproteobacteria bacterium]|nr:type II secretion system secretin GspD [Gammaproteobacteria bacterium]
MQRIVLQLGVLFLVGLTVLPVLAEPVQDTVQTQGSEITLNLKDADIRDVAKMVSNITGKNFIVDPRANGRVTVISAQPISADALFSVFLSVLQVHGLTAVPAGHDTWKIVPAVVGRQNPGYSGKLSAAPNAAMVTQVVQLKNVEVAQLVAALRPLMSSTAQLAAYAASNALIISGRAANVQRIIGLVHELDQPMSSNFELIKLEYASSADVAQVLSSMLGAGRGQGEIPMKIAADPRSNSILVAGSPAARLQVRALIAELDQPTGRTGNTQVVYLHYANAETLSKILQAYVKAKQQAASAEKGNQPVITVMADKDLNALIVTAPAKTMSEIHQIIRDLDVRRSQVLVQGIIAELSSQASAQLGISWGVASSNAAGFTNFPGGVVDIGGQIQASGSTGGTGGFSASRGISLPTGLLFGVGRIVENGTSFVALLRALSSDSSTNILSTPSLVTMDNEEAQLVSGQKVPFVTGQYTNTTGVSQGGAAVINPFQTVDRQQLGITLEITPHINYGGDTVTLELHVKDSSLGPTEPGTVQPSTNNRELKTTVIVKDKQILVLGGLIDTQLQQSKSKVPLLGDIPLLGALFRYQESRKVRKNLMIFLRPVILRNAADINSVTRPRYNQIRELQIGRGSEVPLLPGVQPPVLPVLAPISASGKSAISEKGMLLPPTSSSSQTPSPATSSGPDHVHHR